MFGCCEIIGNDYVLAGAKRFEIQPWKQFIKTSVLIAYIYFGEKNLTDTYIILSVSNETPDFEMPTRVSNKQDCSWKCLEIAFRKTLLINIYIEDTWWDNCIDMSVYTGICFRLIKMSSPNLNDLIIVGCIMTYGTAILLGVDARLLSDSQLQIMCQVIYWLLNSNSINLYLSIPIISLIKHVWLFEKNFKTTPNRLCLIPSLYYRKAKTHSLTLATKLKYYERPHRT